MLLATINSGTLIIALPDLERSLHTSLLDARLGDPRLHDRLDRARAHARAGCRTSSAASRPTSAASSSSRSPRSAPASRPTGTELILWRIAPGRRRRASSSPTPPRSSPTPSRASSSALAMGTNTMVAAVGPRPRAGARRRARRDLLALGVLVQRPVRARSARSGAALRPARAGQAATASRGLDILGTVTFVIGLTGLVFGDLARRPRRAGTTRSSSAGSSSASSCCRCSCSIESRGRAPMLDLTIFRNRLFAAATAAAFINGLSRFALHVRLRLLLPGRAGRRPDHGRHQARAAGARDARRLAARRHRAPTATARARSRRSACSSARSGSPA